MWAGSDGTEEEEWEEERRWKRESGREWKRCMDCGGVNRKFVRKRIGGGGKEGGRN